MEAKTVLKLHPDPFYPLIALSLVKGCLYNPEAAYLPWCYHTCKTGDGDILNTRGQIISPRRSACYQAALSASEPALRIPRHTRVRTRVAAHARRAITEGVGVATVTNTSRPLRRLRAKHLQCLLKALGRETHPRNIP